MRYGCLMAGAMLVSALCHAQGVGKPMVRICDDAAEWPPYSYYVRKNHEKTLELTGYSVDVIKVILTKHAIPYTIELVPWKRCLAELDAGDKYVMALSASENPDRDKQFWFSNSYYKTHYYLFYSTDSHPDGVAVHGQADLNRYRLGGIKGYAYSSLTAVNKDNMVLTGDYVELVKMLHAGRFDIFAEDYEVLAGMSEVGSYDFMGDPKLGRMPLPGVPPNEFHMIFTRKNPQGLQLMRLVNKELESMKKSGELDHLLNIYVPK